MLTTKGYYYISIVCQSLSLVTYCSAKCQKKDWSRHKRLCVPLMVQKTEHKGNGLVASKTFRIGDLILKEKACMSRGKDPGQETHSQLNKMTAEERSDFYNLTRAVHELHIYHAFALQYTASIWLKWMKYYWTEIKMSWCWCKWSKFRSNSNL